MNTRAVVERLKSRRFESPILHFNFAAKAEETLVSTVKIKNPALGAYEAACLMGVHWTRAPKMAATGEIATRTLVSSTGTDRLRVYSMQSVNANWREYEDALASGTLPRRPRANADMRPQMLRELGLVEQHIEFEDAIRVWEAAEILGCMPTFVARMAAKGEIVSRRLLSHREGDSRSLIYSRKSCEANVKAYKQVRGPGRPRRGV